ncbi:MAG TPA: ester cyclase [Gaiellaceae bacterium]|nr:ester cyclase [Gaiellaceae bacterium]
MSDYAAINRTVLERVWGGGEVELLDDIVGPGYVFNDPSLPAPMRSAAEEKALIAKFRSAFPDLSFEIHDELAIGDRVAQRWTVRGTHEGEFDGLPPTGDTIELSGMSFVRFADGKLVEVWTNWDLLGLLRAIGAVPAPV